MNIDTVKESINKAARDAREYAKDCENAYQATRFDGWKYHRDLMLNTAVAMELAAGRLLYDISVFEAETQKNCQKNT